MKKGQTMYPLPHHKVDEYIVAFGLRLPNPDYLLIANRT